MDSGTEGILVLVFSSAPFGMIERSIIDELLTGFPSPFGTSAPSFTFPLNFRFHLFLPSFFILTAGMEYI